MYKLTVEGLIWRFYLLMVVIIVPFYIDKPIFALVALPVFLTALFGMRFSFRKAKRRKLIEKEHSTSVVA
jgi:hypothetical protein